MTAPTTLDMRREQIVYDALVQQVADFNNGYLLGYAAGVQVGYGRGERDEAALWSDALGLVRKAAEQVTQAELERRRAHTDEPCRTNCRRCSRCIRAGWVARHGGDYPGRLSRLDGAA